MKETLRTELKYIELAEEAIGLKFRDTFKNKMIVENGGEIIVKNESWQLIPFFDKSSKKRIIRTSNHIVRENESIKNWNRFPENAIAIGLNGSGDCLLLLIDDIYPNRLSDKIMEWSHENGKLVKIANDIKELL